MGLDMYLTGERDIHQRSSTRHPLKGEQYELGYWRKHPNLHGYIVQTFANGEDHCQEIELDEAALRRIIKAVKANQLPYTSGFFFGVSDGSEKDGDLIILADALEWLTTADAEAWRSVSYRASW